MSEGGAARAGTEASQGSGTGRVGKWAGGRVALRFLQEEGLSADAAREALAVASARIRRFPLLFRRLLRLTALAVEWLAPLLVLGRLARASALAAADFDRLQARLAASPSGWVRALFLLFRFPLMDARAPEPPPPHIPHPLEGMLPSPRSLEEAAALEFDAVVVGSGAGGAAVAVVLATRGLRVAVVEEGGLPYPATTAEALERYYLQQGLVVALPGGTLPVFAGRAVGGTTSINSGTCLRPPRDRLEAFDRLAGTDFATGSLDPWLDEAERLLQVTVPPRSLLGPSAALVQRGLDRLGRGDDAYVLPRCAPACRGSGRCCFVCPCGAKRSTDRAFLPGVVGAGGLLLSRTRATRILPGEEGVTVEVETVGGGNGRRTLRCRHLVLAAGALSTPGLIRANRLGSHWRQAGRNLRIHPATKVFARFPEPVHGTRGVPQGLGFRAEDLPRLNFEGVFTPAVAAAKMMPLAGSALREWLEVYDSVAGFGMSVQDRATGAVDHVAGAPVVRYRLHPDDARDLGRGVLLLAEIFFAAGADRVLLPVVGISNQPRSLAELRRIQASDFTPSRLLAAAFHPQGTAGIGRVVDPDLGLLGCPRVHVCDASVLPDSPRVNPQLTLTALALRLGDRLARRMGR